jgi:uncharacterized protein (DUF433 family)
MIIQLAEFLGIHSQFAGHLDFGMGQTVPFPRINPCDSNRNCFSGESQVGSRSWCPRGLTTATLDWFHMFERITFDPRVMGGRACIRGKRITVSLVLNLVANGMTTDQILVEYPDLEADDIREALQYAASLASEEVQR